MATLTVWKFPTAQGADEAMSTLQELRKQKLIEVYDGATVTWPAGAKKPQTNQMHNPTKAGALGGSFWGLLFGLIFFVPLLGLAIGAAAGALTGALTDVGIDDKFIAKVRDEVTPGTSALFAMTGNAVMERVQEAFKGTDATLISTNLSEDQEKSLREAFADT
jgi:uncharacterized membrane protein